MRFSSYALLVLSFSLLAGCTGQRSTPNATAVFKTAEDSTLTASEYRVAPPDHLKVKASGIKELDVSADAEIRSDGKITLNLLGEVYVAGKTPEEIGRTITAMAKQYYLTPDIKVEVSQYNSKTYQMFGEVVNPGSKRFTGNNTVLKALADAGFTDEGWPQKVSLSRPKHLPEQGEAATRIVEIKHMYMTGDLAENYVLQEGDIIWVPKGPLGQINHDMKSVFGPITGAGTLLATPGAVGHPAGN